MNKRITQLTILFALLTAIIIPTTARAQATTSTTSFTLPLNQIVFVPCANGGVGESVQLSGYRHIVIHRTENGDHVIRKSYVLAKASGTGLTTGDTYHTASMNHHLLTFQSDAEPFIATHIDTLMFIGQGPGNNFIVHLNDHLTFNGNGELITQNFNFHTDCK